MIGLQFLHNSNIMHRDLKLENLMLGTDGYLKIVDFGLVRVLRHGETSYSLVGTPAYFAPEILKGEAYNRTADFWSVGVIMYHMLTGVPPFHNRNLRRQNDDIVNKPL